MAHLVALVEGRLLACSSVITIALASGTALAATPTYYNSLAGFSADVTNTVTDAYENPGYVFLQNDAQMSAVIGETDYTATGHLNVDLVWNAPPDGHYCAGCNGSFELAFTTTSVGTNEGVNGVGMDIVAHDMGTPYYAWITFADGTQADVALPGVGSFWGVSAPERIERIHFGLSMGATTQNGSFAIDNLIVGDGVDMTPCGDGITQAPEECDDAGESAGCDGNCTFVVCGDNVLNVTAGEECDEGGATATCNADCTLPFCGDGVVNAAAGETCDAAGESAACDLDCTAAACGDGTTNLSAGEECDDSAESPSCDPDCTAATCGDGYENNTAGEYCDDGNMVSGDGCSSTCEIDEVSTTSDGGSSGEASTGGGSSDGGGTTGVDGGSSGGPVDGSGDSAPADSSGGDVGSASASASDTSGGGSASASATDGGSTGADSAGISGTEGRGTDVSGCGCDSGHRRGGPMMLLLVIGALARRRRAA